ncbi:MAG: hypothetical protein ACI39U_08255 [Candidatus Cryptobacteroides sp.]
MKKFLTILTAALAGIALSAQTPFLEQLQKRDSILIADQLLYGVNFEKLPEGTGIALPELKDTASVRIVRPWACDTLKVYKPGKESPVARYDIRVGAILTAFDEGEYILPELPVIRQFPGEEPDTLLLESLRFEVRTMPVDTTSYTPHDIKDVVRYPLTFKEVLPYLLIGLLAAALVALIVFLVIRYRKKASGEAVAREPAHITALRKLEEYRGNKLWVPEKQKVFWSGVTDVLREYIASRYGIGAMEMTTAEIFRELKPQFENDSVEKKVLVDEIENMFVTADFVKFAKHTASEQENASVLPLAVKFVTSTYEAELEEEAVAQKKEEK